MQKRKKLPSVKNQIRAIERVLRKVCGHDELSGMRLASESVGHTSHTSAVSRKALMQRFAKRNTQGSSNSGKTRKPTRHRSWSVSMLCGITRYLASEPSTPWMCLIHLTLRIVAQIVCEDFIPIVLDVADSVL